MNDISPIFPSQPFFGVEESKISSLSEEKSIFSLEDDIPSLDPDSIRMTVTAEESLPSFKRSGAFNRSFQAFFSALLTFAQENGAAEEQQKRVSALALSVFQPVFDRLKPLL